jgi:single-strand DNA-binding protein
MNHNQILLGATLTRNPEMTIFGKGKEVCRFGVVMITYLPKAKHHYQRDYIDVIAYGKYADAMMKYMKKGSAIWIDGMMRSIKTDGAMEHVCIMKHWNFGERKPMGTIDEAMIDMDVPPEDVPEI